MLALTRTERQRIFIGTDIVIEVIRIGRGEVKLGISAPRDVPIHREEALVKLHATPAMKEG